MSATPIPENAARFTPEELLEATGGRLEFSCVDMEHSLCYFSRYLAIREHLGEAGAKEVWQMASKHNAKLRPKKAIGCRPLWKLKTLVKITEKGGVASARKAIEEHFAVV